jgi:UPF0755 protein
MTTRAVAAAFVAMLVVAAAGGALWLRHQLDRPGPADAVDLVIPAGLSGREVLDLLHERDLLPSRLAGRLYLRVRAADRWLHYGHYRFPARSRPVDVLERILDGRIEQLTVTVPEGSTVSEVAAVMVAAGVGTEAAWSAVAARTDWIADLAPEATSVEGFLFPDTYQFAVGIGTDDAAHHLVEKFRSVWTRSVARAPEPWGGPLEVVTLASMVEAETSLDDERARVAGVFVNRLRRGMLLQCDPTVAYALKRRGEWRGRLLRIHWQLDDPYNTYRYPGLPPGPINSPGEAALRAALDPERHDYLYFVASPDGGHAFSTTLAAHNRAVARWLRSRR